MEETKRCPYCGEVILAVAKKCKHCGEWLKGKEPEKEKNSCPICGELIDADADICAYCKEPTHFNEIDGHEMESPSIQSKDVESNDKNNSTENTKEKESDLLYCRTCGKSVSINAKNCPYCGDEDPFYLKKIKKVKRIRSWGGFGLFLLVFFMAVFLIAWIWHFQYPKIKLILLPLLILSWVYDSYIVKRIVRKKRDLIGKQLEYRVKFYRDRNVYSRWIHLTDKIINK